MPIWPLVIVPFKLLCFSGWGQWGRTTRMSVFTSGGVGICWWRGWGCWPQIGSATTCRFLILLQSWQQWWWKVQEATWQAWLWSCLWSAVIGESTEATKQGICPNHPFWEDLPHSNVFSCITLDLLHQLHKGVFKDHVVKWATECLEGGEKEIDLTILNHTSRQQLMAFQERHLPCLTVDWYWIQEHGESLPWCSCRPCWAWSHMCCPHYP